MLVSWGDIFPGKDICTAATHIVILAESTPLSPGRAFCLGQPAGGLERQYPVAHHDGSSSVLRRPCVCLTIRIMIPDIHEGLSTRIDQHSIQVNDFVLSVRGVNRTIELYILIDPAVLNVS
jgi:hypothetical protein